jgi:hypothetical protein
MASDFVPKPERPFDRAFRPDVVLAVRQGRDAPMGDDTRRARLAGGVIAEIRRLREHHDDGRSALGSQELACALAAIDGVRSSELVLDVIAIPSESGRYARVEAAERLLMAGVVLPSSSAFALVDSILERSEWMQESDRYLLRRALALCPFVDPPAAGVAKMRDVLNVRRLSGHELCDIVIALGESSSDAAVDLLHDWASNVHTFEACEDHIITALGALDTPRARDLLLGFVDPSINGIALPRRVDRGDTLAARLTELARRSPDAAARLVALCERDLPEFNRHVLSQVMDWLGTAESLAANLSLIDDAKPTPVPRGVWNQLTTAFVERRPYGQRMNSFTEHARASNALRTRLFRMAVEDERRRTSACMILGRIEEWRLEHGRPTDEPRHPDLPSGHSWPPQAGSPMRATP